MSAVEKDERYSRELTERIGLGLDAESFLGTKLGMKVLERAQLEALDAMQTLKNIDPTDEKAIRALQNTIYRAESFERWLNDCMTDGETAQMQLGEQHE